MDMLWLMLAADITDQPAERLIAPIAATGLLVFLIRVIIQDRRSAQQDWKVYREQIAVERSAERAQWHADRAALIQEHRDEVARRDEDKDRTIAFLRAEHADCRDRIEALRQQVRELQGKSI